MRTQLLTHNKIAYNKVVKAFQTSDKTCVVHPTGTGKSFLIAAVSEGYKRVLILGPNVFVLNQVHTVLEWRKDIEYMTYTMLMYTENPKTDYDLICLDEFHRAGAPEWGDAVDNLLEKNPTAKVFGTTATPIRFLDDNRDMADELFEGNIASFMTLKDAWNRNILAVPAFVTGLFEFSKVCDDAIEQINNSKKITREVKRERMTRINNLRLDWERSQGMPQIIRKHIDPKAKRIIVFCGSVEHIKDMSATIERWFKQAGLTPKMYNIHGYMPDNERKDMMDDFEKDDFDGVKVMLSVNLLNEGVHIPRVNGVILLRTTSSKIIYLQQIGRCLTAANTDKPVILDMVDNITTTNIVHDIKEGFDWYEHQNLQEEKEHTNEVKDFVVYDYTLGIQDAIKKLVPQDHKKISFEERFEKLKAFCEKYGRMPGKGDGKEEIDNYHSLCQWWGDRQEFIELREKYGKVKTFESRLAQLESFIAIYDRLPIRKQEPEEYKNFFALRSRNENKPDERMQAILDKYVRKPLDKETLLKEFVAFVEEYKRLPGSQAGSPLYEVNLRRHVREQLSDNPIVQELLEKYKNITILPFEERKKMFLAFVEKNDRLPRFGTEKEEYNNMGRLRKMNIKENDAVLNAIFEKYSVHYTDEQIKQRVLDFFKEKGHLPYKSNSKEEAALYKLMRDHADFVNNDPDIAPLLYTRRKFLSKEDGIQMLIEYTEKYHRRPLTTETRLYNLWIRVTSKDKDDPRVKAMYEKYGGLPNMRMKEYVAPLAEYIHKYHRLPSTTASKEEYHLYAILVNIRMRYADHPDCKPILDEIATFPTHNDKRRAANDEQTKKDIITFVDKHHRLPRFKKDGSKEDYLARQWAARRERLCKDDPTMQAILDQYDNRPLKFEERYALIRDWAAEHGRLPKKSDDVYEKWCTLIRTYRNTPEVKGLMRKYGYKELPARSDVTGMLNEILVWSDEHGRMPSSAAKDIEEKRLGKRWVRLKRNHGDHEIVAILKERYPIQNKR